MTATIGTLAAKGATWFVGREAERRALRELLDPEGPAIVFVHGIAGVGKSALVEAFAAEAAAEGATVVAVDAETTEPTEAGFLRSLSRALGKETGDVASAAAALAGLAPPILLTIDGHERLRLLDDWLRRVLAPAIPSHAGVLVAGRDAPVAAWSARYGRLLRVLELDSLGQPEAIRLLGRLGVPSGRAVSINRVLRGHPLSLHLAASTPSAVAAIGDRAVVTATGELARVYLRELDPATRGALDAASVVRRVTLPLLAAMLPDRPPEDAAARLRALPFVTIGDDGLIVHHVLREAVATELRAVDPPRWRRLRAAAWRQLRDELDDAPDADLWRYTADMLYLLDKPAVRDAFFPTQATAHSVEPARPQDGAAIAAIAERHEPPAGAALARAWWAAAPQAFYVARDAAGAVAGFSAVCQPGEVSPRLLGEDSVAAAWRAHLRAEPLPRAHRALLIRFMCGAEGGERPAPEVSALYLDLKRTYLTLRPALRRLYTCAHELEAMDPILRPLGFEPLGDPPVVLDGVRYETYCNELGPASVDGWLARLAARDVLADGDPPLDEERRQLNLDGARVDLTPLEFGVLRCLEAHTDRVVRRETLLREVWGHEWTGDGNALEAVISATRRKLDRRAGALETVRGVGYRLRPLV